MKQLNRRGFLKSVSAVSGGLLVALRANKTESTEAVEKVEQTSAFGERLTVDECAPILRSPPKHNNTAEVILRKTTKGRNGVEIIEMSTKE